MGHGTGPEEHLLAHSNRSQVLSTSGRSDQKDHASVYSPSSQPEHSVMSHYNDDKTYHAGPICRRIGIYQSLDKWLIQVLGHLQCEAHRDLTLQLCHHRGCLFNLTKSISPLPIHSVIRDRMGL